MIGDALHLAPNPEHRAAMHAHRQRSLLVEGDFVDGVPNLVYGVRQSGKTRLAMKWVLEGRDLGEDRVLVMLNRAIAEHHLLEHGLPRSDARVISWRQLIKRGPRPGAVYGFDAADQIIAEMFRLGRFPALVTVCTSPENPANRV